MPSWQPRQEDFTRLLQEQNPWMSSGRVPDVLARPAEVGREFRETAEASRITQLWGDSATFDYSQYDKPRRHGDHGGRTEVTIFVRPSWSSWLRGFV